MPNAVLWNTCQLLSKSVRRFLLSKSLFHFGVKEAFFAYPSLFFVFFIAISHRFTLHEPHRSCINRIEVVFFL